VKKILYQIYVTTMYIYLVDERVKESWSAVLKKLNDIFGPEFNVFDEGYVLLDH